MIFSINYYYYYLMQPLVFAIFMEMVYCMPASEPACSKFDYEEKLLAKTVRLEISMQDILKSVSDVQTTLVDFDSFKRKLTGIEARLGALESKKGDDEEKAALPNNTCPSTYKYNADLKLCWKLKKSDKRNWFDAQERCEEDEGHLMIFNNANTINAANAIRFMQEWLVAVDVNEVFVGASDMMEEGIYKWTDGETAQNVPWHSGQPGGGVVENCLMMKKSYGYKFGDRGCAIKLEFLCQITLV